MLLEESLGMRPSLVRLRDVYLVDGVGALPLDRIPSLLADSVAQDVFVDRGTLETSEGWDYIVEVTYRPGVTDPQALTARQAIELTYAAELPDQAVVQAGVQYVLGFDAPVAADQFVDLLHNPLIQLAYVISADEWKTGTRPPSRYPHSVSPSPIIVERFDLNRLSREELTGLSRRRLLALEVDELEAIQRYFSDDQTRAARLERGIGVDATDVELEMIAQTWSEHCKHKIFQAIIEYDDGEHHHQIDGLFNSYIRRVTDEVGRTKTYLRSVFTDNSGVVQFHESCLLCFKAETHNSPSALDPYGGAITGIVGVNRDIIGTGRGARPIFNTDVLCFGHPTMPREEVPEGLLHPRTVLRGVHKGIVDGGNQSGIPVVAGAFLFDESYTGKPLVYCGTGGIMPATIEGEPAWKNRVDAGDLAVMVGGRIGKDGIHGATFSSLDLNEASPTSAVQIGDPITQRRMLDFLLEARDHSLFKGITDNGAGGLSSSLGEMAERSGGVVIRLDRCPLKYEGLAPWEILVSESQERMSLAVEPDCIDALLALADRRGVEATVVGEFTDDGFVSVYYGSELVGLIGLRFLHDGLPRMRLDARWRKPETRTPIVTDDVQRWIEDTERSPQRLGEVARAVLSDPNVRSKEELIRQYDHEVQARSVVKPFCGVNASGPTDGGVLQVFPDQPWGISVTHGICPRYGDWDAYDMAACAVDEAVRAHVALGGDPDVTAGLDNFCWPNPIAGPENPDGEYKLAQLVRANQGLYDACAAFGLPLVSGKDSMKNDATLGGRKLSVRPTLLVSLMGYVPDVTNTMTTDFKAPGNFVCIVGASKHELGGSILERVYLRETGEDSPWRQRSSAFGPCPSVDTERATRRYRALHSAVRRGLCRSTHDLSDGGLFVALCECAVGGGCGARIDVSALDLPISAALFGESASRILLEITPRDYDAVSSIFSADLVILGETTADPSITVLHEGNEVVSMTLDDARAAWALGGNRW